MEELMLLSRVNVALHRAGFLNAYPGGTQSLARLNLPTCDFLEDLD